MTQTSRLLLGLLFLTACKDPNSHGSALVVDAAVAPAPVEAGPFDVTQCAGCQGAAPPAWTFEGIYRDAACTEPLAQAAPSACAVIPALGQTSLTYVDEFFARKAGEVATVTVVDPIAPATARYRKAGTKCVRANESAVDLTPMSCAGSRVCRDVAGALVCTGCRTFANGCPDFEETRMYASINDPAAKGAPAANGGNMARLRACCAAIGSEAARLGASPEGAMLVGAAAQCAAMVNGAGPNGNAPELGALRSLLAGRNIPGCAGF